VDSKDIDKSTSITLSGSWFCCTYNVEILLKKRSLFIREKQKSLPCV